jgi:hypothetical protein
MWMHRIRRFLFVGVIAFIVLVVVQVMKGHSLTEAARFAGVWGAVSATLFVATGIYYARKSIDCPICKDPTGPTSPHQR